MHKIRFPRELVQFASFHPSSAGWSPEKLGLTSPLRPLIRNFCYTLSEFPVPIWVPYDLMMHPLRLPEHKPLFPGVLQSLADVPAMIFTCPALLPIAKIRSNLEQTAILDSRTAPRLLQYNSFAGTTLCKWSGWCMGMHLAGYTTSLAMEGLGKPAAGLCFLPVCVLQCPLPVNRVRSSVHRCVR